MPLAAIKEAIEDFKQGKFVIIVDDVKRENEGDLVIAAGKVTPEAINFMTKHARGLLCMPVTSEMLDRLNISMMGRSLDTAMHGTAFAESIDYTKGTTTGISAADRAATIRAVINPKTNPRDFTRPGHTFPLCYREGGVLVRAGHTEGSVDLAQLADLKPATVICEIMKSDGTMARMSDLEALSTEHGINIITIAQLIAHRRRTEKLVQRVGEARLPTTYGNFTIVGYRIYFDPSQHVALVMGEWEPEDDILVRVHSQCFTGDIFGSLRCDCGQQIDQALKAIAAEGRGVFLYMRGDGRGIGLHNKIRAYHLQDDGLDTVEANERLGFDSDPRSYSIGTQILRELGVRKMRLLTNNLQKVISLSSFGVEVTERVPMKVQVTNENRKYLTTKRTRMGHLIDFEE